MPPCQINTPPGPTSARAAAKASPKDWSLCIWATGREVPEVFATATSSSDSDAATSCFDAAIAFPA